VNVVVNVVACRDTPPSRRASTFVRARFVGAEVDGDLRARYEPEAALLGAHVGTHEPVDPVPIGEPEGG